MSKFKVYLMTVAETCVEVEAEDGEEAIDIALASDDLPYAPGFAAYEFGEWTTGSELFPDTHKPENDYEVIDDV